MYPNRHPGPPPQAAQPFKFTVAETCDRIKEEFSFLQAQYHSLKLECEKLASEKTEMQRHYVMYYEMSYGLNVEMHKQTEIAKRLNAIIAQILPFLSQEQQHTGIAHLMSLLQSDGRKSMKQQMHAQQLQPHAHAPPLPMMPHAAAMAGLQPPSLPPSSAAGLLALSSSLAAGGPNSHLTAAAAAAAAAAASSTLKDHRDEKRSSNSLNDERQRNSISPHDREKQRSRTPDLDSDKKRRKEDKHDHVSGMQSLSGKGVTWSELAALCFPAQQGSDGEKSDQDLIVDIANEEPLSPPNGEPSPRENGTDRGSIKRDRPPSRSGSSSSRSTPVSSKHKENVNTEKMEFGHGPLGVNSL